MNTLFTEERLDAVFDLMNRGVLTRSDDLATLFSEMQYAPAYDFIKERALLDRSYYDHHVTLQLRGMYAMKPQETIDSIFPAISPVDNNLRGMVISFLKQTKDPHALQVIENDLFGPEQPGVINANDAEVWKLEKDILVSYGDDAIPLLVSRLKTAQYDYVRKEIEETLGDFADGGTDLTPYAAELFERFSQLTFSSLPEIHEKIRIGGLLAGTKGLSQQQMNDLALTSMVSVFVLGADTTHQDASVSIIQHLVQNSKDEGREEELSAILQPYAKELVSLSIGREAYQDILLKYLALGIPGSSISYAHSQKTLVAMGDVSARALLPYLGDESIVPSGRWRGEMHYTLAKDLLKDIGTPALPALTELFSDPDKALLAADAKIFRQRRTPLSEGRAESLRKGSSGMDAARAARAMDGPSQRAPGATTEGGDPERSAGPDDRGKRFCLLFSRLKKVSRRARRNLLSGPRKALRFHTENEAHTQLPDALHHGQGRSQRGVIAPPHFPRINLRNPNRLG